MVKDDLVQDMSGLLNLNRQESRTVVESLLATITGYITSKERLEVRGFGTFFATKRKSKPARVITTGETVQVPARYVPKFIPGTVLKKIVKESSK